MNKFIKGVVYFGLICTVIYSLQVVIIMTISKDKGLKINQDKHILLVGNSQPECAVNDSICTTIFNLSASSETSPISFVKIRQILQDNPNIDTIMVGFNPLYVNNNADYWFYSRQHYAEIAPFWSYDDFKCFPFNLQNFGLRSFRALLLNLNGLKSLGGYNYLVRDKLQADIQRRESQSVSEEQPQGNKMSLLYINKIIALCKKNDIKLIFINTPTYQASKYFDTQDFYRLYNDNFATIEFWDYIDMQLPDSCFGDINHLNHRGAKIFSETLKLRINEQKN